MAESVECPHCGALVTRQVVPTDVIEQHVVVEQDVATCPTCGRDFSWPVETGSALEEPADDHTLSAKRVRLLSATKRSILRTRTYALVGAGLAFAATLLLLGKFITGYQREGLGYRQVAFLVVATAALAASRQLARLCYRLTKALNATTLPEPTTPPDFTPLDNGSGRWRNLEDVK
jgi:hypothetical protein